MKIGSDGNLKYITWSYDQNGIIESIVVQLLSVLNRYNANHDTVRFNPPQRQLPSPDNFFFFFVICVGILFIRIIFNVYRDRIS